MERRKYLAIFESLPNPVVLLDTNNQIDHMNQSAAELFPRFPWPKEELADFVSQDLPELCFEKEFTDGKQHRFFEVRVTRILDVSAKYNGTVVILNELTKHKQAEKALKESEKRFREMLEDIQLLSVMLDVRGNIIFCNDFLLKLTGRSRKEVVGRAWFEIFVAEKSQERVKQVFLDLISKGSTLKNFHFENEIVTKKGVSLLISWNTTVLKDAQGTVVGITSLGEDITERRLTEKALTRSRDYYLNMFEEFPVLIWMSDIKSKFNYFNKYWLGFTGRRLTQEIGDGWLSGVHPDDAKRRLQTFHEVFAAQEPFEMEYRLRRHYNVPACQDTKFDLLR